VRIGMFSPYSLTLPGGVQGQVLGLARALRRQGHVVRVLGPCDGPPPESGVTPLGNAVPLAANGSVAPIAPDPAAALRTIRVLNDEEFDVIHLHEPLVPGPNLTALLYKPAPILGTFHAAGRSSSYRILQRPLAWGAKKLDLRVAVSADAEALAKASLGGEYTLLFNGVDTNRFLGSRPAPTEGPTVLFVGRHEERKGLGVLLEAHATMAKNVRLWIVGSGPQTSELRAHFPSPMISWLGRVDDATLASYWTGAHAYCAPSLGGESFGVVLLESMAAGTPVVASDIDGYRSVARHEQDGLLVAPGEPIALAQALGRVLGDQGLAQGLRKRGLERAAEFSMDTLATRYGELYETIRRR
jgi:phosphatidyl-myo-inositol alpha-mannosyltransferase